MDQEQIKVLIKKNPVLVYGAVGVAVLALWGLFMMQGSPEPKKEADNSKFSPAGLSVGGVDQQARLARLDRNYDDFEDRLKSIEGQVKSMVSITKELKGRQKEMIKDNEKLSKQIEERTSQTQQEAAPSESLELAVADISPLQKHDEDSVYLPMGSFCKGTLLTGVYAVADANNPLPVLISLDEAFYGPNKTRIPLKGAFVLGQAHGDLVSERALIQITAISSVLPNGHAFEEEDKLGYVTDQFGELGIRGRVIRNTGKQLATSFLGGFLSGGAQALADAEVTTSEGRFGETRRQVTGDASKNAIFSGLSNTGERMSDYYEKQAENLVPAVHIRNGAIVYFIIQKGVRIHGLPRSHYAHVSTIN